MKLLIEPTGQHALYNGIAVRVFHGIQKPTSAQELKDIGQEVPCTVYVAEILPLKAAHVISQELTECAAALSAEQPVTEQPATEQLKVLAAPCPHCEAMARPNLKWVEVAGQTFLSSEHVGKLLEPSVN